MKKLLRGLGLALIFLAAVAATAAGLGRLDPIGAVPGIKEKWDYWRAHKDEFDTLFIGTSRVYRGLLPSVFDELTATAGVPTHSFNFGLDGLFPPEDGYVLDQLLADPPKNLRWVITEIGGFNKDLDRQNPENVRSVYWHDWPRTALAIRAMLEPEKKNKWKRWFRTERRGRKLAMIAAIQTRLFLRKSLNLSHGSDWLARRFIPVETTAAIVLGPRGDGFVPIPDAVMSGAALARYRESCAEVRPAEITPLDPYAEASLARALNRIRSVGAEPFAVLAPSTLRNREHPSAALNVPVFDLHDMVTYPELFTEDVRCDTAHVNAKGAIIFTRLVAEKFIALRQAQPGHPR